MGFNRRKIEDERRRVVEKKAAELSATNPQILGDAERLITDWNERQEKRMPMLFSPTISAAIVVKDSGGQKLAAVYYEEEPGRGN